MKRSYKNIRRIHIKLTKYQKAVSNQKRSEQEEKTKRKNEDEFRKQGI